ncbi:AraC family transcriptional regulator [Pseudomonas brassicacearum]|uniref:AraC family transcriptional regulator n=1 Tax=Pseudomonas brassicacearum TaxID=930166 RepID=UPI0021824DD8|nr:AraC family transcriptional regulator [Pseudomonas brassicacearum]
MVIRNLLEQTGRPGLGFITGQHYHLTSLGLLGFTMLASRTLIEAFATFSRFQLIALTLCPTRLERDRRGMWLLFDTSVLPRDARAFVIERGLAACLRISSELLQRRANPLAVNMTMSNTEEQAALQPLFGYPLSLSATRDGILFSSQELNSPLPQAHVDAQLQGEVLCERQCLQTAHPLAEAPTARQVQTVLIRYSSELLSCRSVAEHMGLSERTLQRRLASEGHGFQQLNEHIKQQLAERLLSNTRLDIQTIAQRLGYAEAASFSRAFNRWTGCPPSHWQYLHSLKGI